MDETALAAYFEKTRRVLEEGYLAHNEPWRQSGMSGPYQRWVSLRKPVADAVQHSGSFLDTGCANGYLLECLLLWTAERGLHIEAHGLDLSERQVELARRRLPHCSANLHVGNAWDWTPPQRYDFVRTELCYVPAALERAYLERLAQDFLAPDGRLLVANYAESHPEPEKTVFPENTPITDLLARLEQLGIRPEAHFDGYDPIKDRRTRVASLTRASVLGA